MYLGHARIQRGGGAGDTDPPEKSQTFGVSGSPENHKATKPAFNIGPTPAHQRNAIKMAFHWRADDGPLIVVIGSSLPSSPNKKSQSWTPPLTKLSGSAHVGVSGYNFKKCIILSFVTYLFAQKKIKVLHSLVIS